MTIKGWYNPLEILRNLTKKWTKKCNLGKPPCCLPFAEAIVPRGYNFSPFSASLDFVIATILVIKLQNSSILWCKIVGTMARGIFYETIELIVHWKKYILLGEILSCGRATLLKKPSVQTVLSHWLSLNRDLTKAFSCFEEFRKCTFLQNMW